jgi:hypothetical protein
MDDEKFNIDHYAAFMLLVLISVMLLCSLVFSCCSYEKHGLEEMGIAKLIKIRPTELGYFLDWQDNKKIIHTTFRHDTFEIHIGDQITTFVRK